LSDDNVNGAGYSMVRWGAGAGTISKDIATGYNAVYRTHLGKAQALHFKAGPVNGHIRAALYDAGIPAPAAALAGPGYFQMGFFPSGAVYTACDSSPANDVVHTNPVVWSSSTVGSIQYDKASGNILFYLDTTLTRTCTPASAPSGLEAAYSIYENTQTVLDAFVELFPFALQDNSLSAGPTSTLTAGLTVDATTAFSVTRPASAGNSWDFRAITNYNNVYSIRGIPSTTAFTGFMGLTDSSISSETDFSSGTTSKRTGIYFDAGGVMKAQCNGVLGSTLGTSFTTSGNVKVKYVQSTNSVEMTYGTTPLST
jgi:hypothetical protein